VHKDVLKSFSQYHWPGNVRELENLLERAANIALSGHLTLNHFQRFGLKLLDGTTSEPAEKFSNLNHMRDKLEKDAIVNALRITKGNKKRAAEMLQIDRSVLYNKLNRYNIDFKKAKT
jgi:transcriptional regulator with PAS, ATPase and Fis domain